MYLYTGDKTSRDYEDEKEDKKEFYPIKRFTYNLMVCACAKSDGWPNKLHYLLGQPSDAT